MAWISLFFLMASIQAAPLPTFLTKHASDTLRFITMDGRYAYIQKKPGVLGLVSSFRSTDFMSDAVESDFLVKGSRFEEKILIEVIPNVHTEYNLFKNHKIHVVAWGNSIPKEVGFGRSSKLQLGDEWVSYFDAYEKVIILQSLSTDKKHTIRLTGKNNSFFIPEVEMVNEDTVLYTDTNATGHSALVSMDLLNNKTNIIYKSTETATKIELCQNREYVAIGEFPHDGVVRPSKIMQIKIPGGGSSFNLAGYSTIYNSPLGDLGNMLCQQSSIFFVKTLAQDSKLGNKITEAARLDLKNLKTELRSDLQSVTQLVEMNGRILIPLRGDFYVVEGKSNIGVDVLKSMPSENKEELPLDI